MFGFCFLCVYYGHILFSKRDLVLINLTAIFLEKICWTCECVNYGCIRPMIITIFHSLPIKANSNQKPTLFLGITTLFYLAYCCTGQDFLKKYQFFQFATGYQTEINLFCRLETTSRLWKTWSLGLQAHNSLSHSQFFKVGAKTVVEIRVLDATRGISRWSSSLVWCSSCKIACLGDSNLQMITTKFWCEYPMCCFWTRSCE